MGAWGSVLAGALGGALGAMYGFFAGRYVAGRAAWWFWLAAIGGFMAGVAVMVAGNVIGERPVFVGGLAFAIVAATGVKWAGGHVPGVPPARGRES